MLLVFPSDSMPNDAWVGTDHKRRVLDIQKQLDRFEILDDSFRRTPVQVVDQDDQRIDVAVLSMFANCFRKPRTSNGPEATYPFRVTPPNRPSTYPADLSPLELNRLRRRLVVVRFLFLPGHQRSKRIHKRRYQRCSTGCIGPIAGRATCFRPRLATRIQLTDLSNETHLSRTLGPNRLCSPIATSTELRIADLASSYPSKSHPLKYRQAIFSTPCLL